MRRLLTLPAVLLLGACGAHRVSTDPYHGGVSRRRRMKTPSWGLTLLIAGLGLASCGGGDLKQPLPPTDPPPGAVDSVRFGPTRFGTFNLSPQGSFAVGFWYLVVDTMNQPVAGAFARFRVTGRTMLPSDVIYSDGQGNGHVYWYQPAPLVQTDSLFGCLAPPGRVCTPTTYMASHGPAP